ncbi:MAG: hypothetical protein OEV90_03605 [Gammaproteobacteria bacterium]|nr:hypothetical protein [Gammaproteobacteria bacterium]
MSGMNCCTCGGAVERMERCAAWFPPGCTSVLCGLALRMFGGDMTIGFDADIF